MHLGRQHANYGRGEHTIELGIADEPEAIAARLMEQLRSKQCDPPKLPQVGLELMELARRPDVDFRQFSAVIEKDPLLAAKVLRIAQSPAYATSVPLKTLPQALSRLGLGTVADIVLEASMNLTLFRAPGLDEVMNELRRHSTATAYIARIISAHTRFDDDYAFLCGLLHDIGIVAGIIVLTRSGETLPPYDTKLKPALVRIHERAAAALAEEWKLAPEVGWVISHHHQLRFKGRIHGVAAAVALADYLAGQLGMGARHHSPTTLLVEARAALRLEGPVLDRIRAEAQEAIAGIE
ncbi:MAG: HDOD domain-containing protein [Polyangiaceae bacterium]